MLKRQIPADPKAEQLIEQVDGEVQSLNQLVSEFLDFARPTPLQTEAVDLADVVASVLALLDAELRSGAVEVQTINLDTLPTIEADADQLKWVFTNLVKNAAQAIDQGGTIAIEGFVDADSDTIRVEVRDTGVGMSPETAERAFIPFLPRKTRARGLGWPSSNGWSSITAERSNARVSKATVRRLPSNCRRL